MRTPRPLAPLLALAFACALTMARGAHAADPVPADAVDAGERAGLLVTARDPTGRLGGASLLLRVQDGDGVIDVPLADGGEAPDARAGDGVLVGATGDAPVSQDVQVALLGRGGEELWSGTVPVVEGATRTQVDFSIFTRHVEAAVAVTPVGSTGPAVGAPPPPPGTLGSPTPGMPGTPMPGVGGAPPKPGGGSGAALPSDISGGAGLVVLGLMGLLGSLAGFVLGILVGRSRTTAAPLAVVGPRPAGPEAPWPTAEQPAVWSVLEGEALGVVATAARRLASMGPVLVVVPREHQEALAASLSGVPGIVTSARPQPSLAELFDGADHLRGVGLPFLVVLDPDAVEPPEADEADDAVLADLFEEARGALPALVVLSRPTAGGVAATARAGLDGGGGLTLETVPAA